MLPCLCTQLDDSSRWEISHAIEHNTDMKLSLIFHLSVCETRNLRQLWSICVAPHQKDLPGLCTAYDNKRLRRRSRSRWLIPLWGQWISAHCCTVNIFAASRWYALWVREFMTICGGEGERERGTTSLWGHSGIYICITVSVRTDSPCVFSSQ